MLRRHRLLVPLLWIAPAVASADVHFLEKADWCVSNTAPDVEYASCVMAAQTDPPDDEGYATFKWTYGADPIFSQHFYKTHVATRAELQPGVLVLYVTGEPWDRDSALKEQYRFARFAGTWSDTDPKQPCIGSRCYPASSSLRIVDGDPVKPIKVRGKVDRHFYTADHWFVYDDDYGRTPLPESLDGVVLYPALAIRAPAKNGEAGDYVTMKSVRIVTKAAYRLRLATDDDVKTGALVVVPSNTYDKGGPPTAYDAQREHWQVRKVVEAQVDDGITYASFGGRRAPTSALRMFTTK
jgi:hypothetical protein